jgi:uncharacterized protein
MDVTPLVPAGQQLIQGYGDGGFRISGQRWEGSVLVFPAQTLAWPVASLNEVTAASLAEVTAAAADVSVLLLGCGAQMALISATLRHELRAAGIVVEVMDTGAACRTYNVLLAEGRRIAAALIAV